MNDNPYPNASDTMHYELHTAWDEGYAEGFAAGVAAERDQAWRWTIHVCPKGHKSLEPPLNGVCWKCWPGGRGPAEEHTAIRVAEVRR